MTNRREILYCENFDLNNILTPIKVDVFYQMLHEANYDQGEIELLMEGFTKGLTLVTNVT